MSKRDPTKTTPATLWTDAKHLRIAAETLVRSRNAAKRTAAKTGQTKSVRANQLVHPIFLLVGSSIEAGFKAYLNQKGFSLDLLAWPRYFGHDLHKLQREVLNQTQTDSALAMIVNKATPIIDLLNGPYKDKHFNYRQITVARYPDPGAVCRWIKAYLAKIKPLVNLPVRPDGSD